MGTRRRCQCMLLSLLIYEVFVCSLKADLLAKGTWSDTWEQASRGALGVRISLCGDAHVTLDGRTVMPLGTLRVIHAKHGPKTTHADGAEGPGIWQRVAAQHTNTDTSDTFTVSGRLYGIDIVQTVVLTREEVALTWQGKVTTPTPEVQAPLFLGGFSRPLADLPATVTTADGETLSGPMESLPGRVQQPLSVQVQTAHGLLALSLPPQGRTRLDWSEEKARPLRVNPHWYHWPEQGGALAPGTTLHYAVRVRLGHEGAAAVSPETSGKTVTGPPARPLPLFAALRNPKGHEDPFFRWNAHLVGLERTPTRKEEIDNDYATHYYGDAWDFDEGDTEGIAVFSDGVKDAVVSDGTLRFTTGENAHFYWGAHFAGDRARDEHIGFNWTPLYQSAHWKHWHVRLRLRQSEPESHWTVSARPMGTCRKAVEGRGWQVVDFRMGPTIKVNALRRRSLCIATDTPENRVEVDWVHVVERSAHLHARARLVLPEAVREARVVLLPHSTWALYVNGLPAAEGTGGDQRRSCVTVDLSGRLREGENVLAYRQQVFGRSGPRVGGRFVLEGAAVLADGKTVRFASGPEWRGSFTADDDWTEQEFDDSEWNVLTDRGNVVDSDLPARGPHGWGHVVDPPYLGPIGLTIPGKTTPDDFPPLFKAEDGAELLFSLPRSTGQDRMTYTLIDAFEGTEVVSGDVVPEAPSAGSAVPYRLQLAPRKAGVYNLSVRAERDGVLLDTRYEEIALVGRLSQREVPFDRVADETPRRLVDDIHCGDPNDPHPLLQGYAAGKNRVSTIGPESTRLGTYRGTPYRESRPGMVDWFSYKFEIENPSRPHLVVVTYLDNRRCGVEVRVTEEHRRTYSKLGHIKAARATMGAFTGGGPLFPPTGEFQDMQLTYYPRHKDATVEIVNIGSGGGRAAVSRIRVFELGELPAVAVPNGRRRFYGTHTENSALRPRDYYNGEQGEAFSYVGGTHGHRHFGFLKAWWQTYENQIRHMRWAGQNTFFLGAWMYSKKCYPSRVSPNGFPKVHYDSLGLMFAMFEANGLTLVPAIEYMASNNLQHRYWATDAEVAAGRETVVSVDRTGKQVTYGPRPTWNSFDPVVQQEIARVAGEIARLFGHYRSCPGVALAAGGSYWLPSAPRPGRIAAWDEILDHGYGDRTIRAFEQDTGIKVPVNTRDPHRFEKRHAWLTGPARKAWVEWRCRAIARAHLLIRDAIRDERKDLDYFLFGLPSPQNAGGFADRFLQGHDPAELYRDIGFDPALYRNVDGLVFGWMPQAEQSRERFGGGWNGAIGSVKALNTAKSNVAVLDNGYRTAVVYKTNFYENLIRLPGGVWLWRLSRGNPWPMMGHRYYPHFLVERLLHATPQMIIFPFTDVQMYHGQEHLQRRFAAAFRSLPRGEYEPVLGHGLDRNMVVRQAVRDGKRFVYALNPYWWEVYVRLSLSGEADVLNLVRDRPIARDTEGQVRLDLEPYDLIVLSMPESVRLTGATTTVSDETRSFFDREMAVLRTFPDHDTGQVCGRVGLWVKPDEARELVATAEAAWQAGNFLALRQILEHPFMIRLMAYLNARQEARLHRTFPDRYHVNAGLDEAYTDPSGRAWQPDQPYNYGASLYGYSGEMTRAIDRGAETAIAGTDADRLYQTERCGTLGYRFQVPAGVYDVTLHFAECSKYRPGTWTMDVVIEGRPVLKDWDMNADAGGFQVALVKHFKSIRVEDGELAIDFPFGKVMALEIVPHEE